LTIDGKHYGQFWYIPAHAGLNHPDHPPTEGHWRFASNTNQEFEAMIDYFERAVIAAMEDE
jgi:hypothetical protein